MCRLLYSSLFCLSLFLGCLDFVLAQEQLGEALPDNLGTTLERESGGFINIRIVGGYFRVYFLDAESKLIEPNYPRGVIRYKVRKEYNRSITVSIQRPEEKPYLEAIRPIPPPYRYYLTLILMQNKDRPVLGLPEQEYFPRILVNQL